MQYHIAIVGNNKTGKTTFIDSHTHKNQNQVPTTTNVERGPINFWTNYGNITFYVKDNSGDQTVENVKLISESSKSYSGFIIIFDYLNQLSYIDINFWKQVIHINQPHVPIVTCMNSFDSPGIVMPGYIMLTSYQCVISKGSDKPFLYLARKLSGHDDLEFIQTSEMQLLILRSLSEKHQQKS